jgi:hypothetical protein
MEPTHLLTRSRASYPQPANPVYSPILYFYGYIAILPSHFTCISQLASSLWCYN